MGNLLFLLAAIVVIALATLVVALRAREPKGFDSGIKAHQRHMTALSPEIRKDSTGIDRIQPVRRVDPLASSPPAGDASQPGRGEAPPSTTGTGAPAGAPAGAGRGTDPLVPPVGPDPAQSAGAPEPGGPVDPASGPVRPGRGATPAPGPTSAHGADGAVPESRPEG